MPEDPPDGPGEIDGQRDLSDAISSQDHIGKVAGRSVPSRPMAKATSDLAKAGPSFTPSPTMPSR